MIVKNISGVEKIYSGQTVAHNATYDIEPQELNTWRNDTLVISDMADGNLQFSLDGNNFYIGAAAVRKFLEVDYEIDSDGAQITRVKTTQTGWHYEPQWVELTTATLNGFYFKDKAGSDLAGITFKLYDANNVETNDGALAVKTVLLWQPPFDIEIFGVRIYQAQAPTQDVRFWITAAPHIPSNYGGDIRFTNGGHNLKLLPEYVQLDGKTAKRVNHDPVYASNRFEVIVKHPAGYAHNFGFMVEMYRA